MARDARPGLRRADSKPLNVNKEPEAFRQLGVTVESVHYYCDKDAGTWLSAVLLNVCFDLPAGRFLKSASLPLVAKAKSGAELDIEIFGNHPSADEHVIVETVDGKKHIRATPSLNVNAGPVGVGLSDLGLEKELNFQREFSILLSPKRVKFDSLPTQLSWVFQGHKHTIYPSNIRLLVIVHGPNGHKSDFPFQLHIQNGLWVHTQGYGSRSGHLFRFPFLSMFRKRRKSKHQGWYFDIATEFKPLEAQQVLDSQNQPEHENPHHVGLMAAWSTARKRPNHKDVQRVSLTNMHVQNYAFYSELPNVQSMAQIPGYVPSAVAVPTAPQVQFQPLPVSGHSRIPHVSVRQVA